MAAETETEIRKPSFPRQASVIPFRHSKLTELFQSFFCGDGSAIIIAAVNPYRTAYDENLQVLKFAAEAQQAATVQRMAPRLTVVAEDARPVPRHQQPLTRSRPTRSNVTTISTPQPLTGDLFEESATAPEIDCDEDSARGSMETYETQSCDDDESDGDDVFVEALLEELRVLRRRVSDRSLRP